MVQKKLSVKEIAEMAGTSVATVSRVINQNGRFSKDTEKRVKEIIEKYDYQPNQLARGLRVNHTQVIGILVPDITNEFFVLPEKKNRRIVKQDGAFIIYGLINENNDVINKYRYKEKNKIQIFIVKSGKKEEILKELDALSINKATLFPEIEDVAEYIKKKY